MVQRLQQKQLCHHDHHHQHPKYHQQQQDRHHQKMYHRRQQQQLQQERQSYQQRLVRDQEDYYEQFYPACPSTRHYNSLASLDFQCSQLTASRYYRHKAPAAWTATRLDSHGGYYGFHSQTPDPPETVASPLSDQSHFRVQGRVKNLPVKHQGEGRLPVSPYTDGSKTFRKSADHHGEDTDQSSPSYHRPNSHKKAEMKIVYKARKDRKGQRMRSSSCQRKTSSLTEEKSPKAWDTLGERAAAGGYRKANLCSWKAVSRHRVKKGLEQSLRAKLCLVGKTFLLAVVDQMLEADLCCYIHALGGSVQTQKVDGSVYAVLTDLQPDLDWDLRPADRSIVLGAIRRVGSSPLHVTSLPSSRGRATLKAAQQKKKREQQHHYQQEQQQHQPSTSYSRSQSVVAPQGRPVEEKMGVQSIYPYVRESSHTVNGEDPVQGNVLYISPPHQTDDRVPKDSRHLFTLSEYRTWRVVCNQHRATIRNAEFSGLEVHDARTFKLGMAGRFQQVQQLKGTLSQRRVKRVYSQVHQDNEVKAIRVDHTTKRYKPIFRMFNEIPKNLLSLPSGPPAPPLPSPLHLALGGDDNSEDCGDELCPPGDSKKEELDTAEHRRRALESGVEQRLDPGRVTGLIKDSVVNEQGVRPTITGHPEGFRSSPHYQRQDVERQDTTSAITVNDIPCNVANTAPAESAEHCRTLADAGPREDGHGDAKPATVSDQGQTDMCDQNHPRKDKDSGGGGGGSLSCLQQTAVNSEVTRDDAALGHHHSRQGAIRTRERQADQEDAQMGEVDRCRAVSRKSVKKKLHHKFALTIPKFRRSATERKRYCGLCRRHFNGSLIVHLQTSKHERCANNFKLFSARDKLLASFPTVETFIQSLTRPDHRTSDQRNRNSTTTSIQQNIQRTAHAQKPGPTAYGEQRWVETAATPIAACGQEGSAENGNVNGTEKVETTPGDKLDKSYRSHVGHETRFPDNSIEGNNNSMRCDDNLYSWSLQEANRESEDDKAGFDSETTVLYDYHDVGIAQRGRELCSPEQVGELTKDSVASIRPGFSGQTTTASIDNGDDQQMVKRKGQECCVVFDRLERTRSTKGSPLYTIVDTSAPLLNRSPGLGKDKRTDGRPRDVAPSGYTDTGSGNKSQAPYRTLPGCVTNTVSGNGQCHHGEPCAQQCNKVTAVNSAKDARTPENDFSGLTVIDIGQDIHNDGEGETDAVQSDTDSVTGLDEVIAREVHQSTEAYSYRGQSVFKTANVLAEPQRGKHEEQSDGFGLICPTGTELAQHVHYKKHCHTETENSSVGRTMASKTSVLRTPYQNAGMIKTTSATPKIQTGLVENHPSSYHCPGSQNCKAADTMSSDISESGQISDHERSDKHVQQYISSSDTSEEKDNSSAEEESRDFVGMRTCTRLRRRCPTQTVVNTTSLPLSSFEEFVEREIGQLISDEHHHHHKKQNRPLFKTARDRMESHTVNSLPTEHLGENKVAEHVGSVPVGYTECASGTTPFWKFIAMSTFLGKSDCIEVKEIAEDPHDNAEVTEPRSVKEPEAVGRTKKRPSRRKSELEKLRVMSVANCPPLVDHDGQNVFPEGYYPRRNKNQHEAVKVKGQLSTLAPKIVQLLSEKTPVRRSRRQKPQVTYKEPHSTDSLNEEEHAAYQVHKKQSMRQDEIHVITTNTSQSRFRHEHQTERRKCLGITLATTQHDDGDEIKSTVLPPERCGLKEPRVYHPPRVSKDRRRFHKNLVKTLKGEVVEAAAVSSFLNTVAVFGVENEMTGEALTCTHSHPLGGEGAIQEDHVSDSDNDAWQNESYSTAQIKLTCQRKLDFHGRTKKVSNKGKKNRKLGKADHLSNMEWQVVSSYTSPTHHRHNQTPLTAEQREDLEAERAEQQTRGIGLNTSFDPDQHFTWKLNEPPQTPLEPKATMTVPRVVLRRTPIIRTSPKGKEEGEEDAQNPPCQRQKVIRTSKRHGHRKMKQRKMEFATKASHGLQESDDRDYQEGSSATAETTRHAYRLEKRESVGSEGVFSCDDNPKGRARIAEDQPAMLNYIVSSPQAKLPAEEVRQRETLATTHSAPKTNGVVRPEECWRRTQARKGVDGIRIEINSKQGRTPSLASRDGYCCRMLKEKEGSSVAAANQLEVHDLSITCGCFCSLPAPCEVCVKDGVTSTDDESQMIN